MNKLFLYLWAILCVTAIKAQTVQQTFYIDFGTNDHINGNSTISPDSFGHYWNNLISPSLNASIKLINSANTNTAYTLTVTSPMSVNGILNGGLLNPSPTNLGDLAIANATQDYFYTTSTGSLKLSGLNAGKGYRFYIFGSRSQADPARFTTYTLTGGNSFSGSLQTSGTNLGGIGNNGNNSTMLTTGLINSTSGGEIAIDISTLAGGFAYINLMKVEEMSNSQIDATSISIIGNDITTAGTNSQMNIAYSPSNATPSNIKWSVSDTSIALININGLLIPRKNGNVTVTASILQNGSWLTTTKIIAISHQIDSLFLFGTATEKGISDGLLMNAVVDSVGRIISGQFELYTHLNQTGTISFGSSTDINQAVLYGSGLGKGSLQSNGSPITPSRTGNVLIRINLAAYTYTIFPIDTSRISMMGSSVAYGLYATNHQGYTYKFTQLLNQRYAAGKGLKWTVSNISIPGNSTVNLLSRWNADLLNDTSKYVIYAVSLYNEGIVNGGLPIFNQFKNNLQTLISKARSAGKVVIVANNYANNYYGATQYTFIKQMNIFIHQWDLPSINLLGANDNGVGNWAAGYNYSDGIHPNDSGYTEMSYSLVPSLFDALSVGKPLPQRVTGTYLSLGKSVTTDRLIFTPENTCHSFTLSFGVRTTSKGVVASFNQGNVFGRLEIDSLTGFIKYISPNGGTILGNSMINDGQWHQITLTHYFAKGQTILYNDSTIADSINEKLLASSFFLNDMNAPTAIDYKDLLFYRSAMNIDEITAVCNGKMLKSSLELFAPLDGKALISNNALTNFAQSTNTLTIMPTFPMPVTFIRLNVTQQSNGNEINWLTTNELNISHYEIEKSIDGIHFNSIGSVSASANLSNNYSFIDTYFPNQSSYYRVKAVERGGGENFSSIVSIKVRTDNNSFYLFPNPNHGKIINIGLHNVLPDDLNFKVYNPIGQLVSEYSIQHKGGNAVYRFPENNLSKGSYQVIISNKKTIIANETLIVD